MICELLIHDASPTRFEVFTHLSSFMALNHSPSPLDTAYSFARVAANGLGIIIAEHESVLNHASKAIVRKLYPQVHHVSAAQGGLCQIN